NRAIDNVVNSINDLEKVAEQIGYPIVMKVVGPVHKSDVGGVALNIRDITKAVSEMNRMMKIDGATGVLLQPMLSGVELFAGVKKEGKFGHLLLFGLGGIFIEVLKDVRAMLAPVNKDEVLAEIKKLKSYKIIEGIRGMDSVDENMFADVIVRLSALVQAAPEIIELDLNPLLGNKNDVTAVDARVRVKI
ncbi:MAG: acetate--CoA ligase family protein, partial [Bacteroidetes bacterium]|nr:acetate--CoA ligase family protein [Bacteroidota bacterium]